MQHGSIANPIAGRRIGGVEQCLELFSQEIGDQTGIGFLEGDRQNAADLLKRRRLTIFEEVRKWKKDLIAANRTLRVSGAFLRVSSRYSRKALTSPESICSSISADGVTLCLAAANSKRSWKL
jgi:hypothetical protein